MNDTIQVWCSRFWESRGIFPIEGRISTENPQYFVGNGDSGWLWLSKGFWHRERIDALRAAEEARKKRILSLKKQLRKLEGLKFL